MKNTSKPLTTFDGEKLRSARLEREWKQVEAALNAGVGVSTYINAENGRPIESVKADKIAKAFGSERTAFVAAPRRKRSA